MISASDPHFGRGFRDALLQGLRARVEERLTRPWDDIEADIVRESDRLLQRNVSSRTDAGSAYWLGRACHVLAAFRVLASLGQAQADLLADLRATVVEQFDRQVDRYLVDRFGIDPDKPAEAFDRIAENFLTTGQARFGAAFTYECDVQDAARSFINIRRCGYHQFFRENGAPEVTQVFCALDIAWADEMRRRRYPVAFERPTTLAQGHDACRFQFTRSPEAR